MEWEREPQMAFLARVEWEVLRECRCRGHSGGTGWHAVVRTALRRVSGSMGDLR